MKTLSSQLQNFTALEAYLAAVGSNTKNLFTAEDFPTNCYLAPGYDLIKLTQELREEVNGSGAMIEQSYHYITDQGAMSWLSQATQEDYVAEYNSLPMEEIVDAVVHRLKKTSFDQESLDILALGCGHAREERRLIQALQKKTKIQKIRLFLFDISPFLLNSAFQRTQELFADNSDIQVTGIYGNFHHLQRYQDLLSTSARSNRMLLVSFLGGTWTNLENELLLLRTGFRSLPLHTILLMDVVERYAPADQPDILRVQDPRLAGTSKWRKESEEFLSSPLLTYRKGARDQKVRWEFVLDDHTSQVPNSYVIEVRAHLDPNIQFVLRKYKRYQQEGLQDVFLRENWQLFRSFPFKGNRLACLFQKR